MTINELIKQLETLREKEGNCKIVVRTYLDQNYDTVYRAEKERQYEDGGTFGTLGY